ncbi:tol-pal system protein YbgF [Hyphomonas sp. WL0036]|uniref:tol-pal system protein YbgF n=1 Tax=Hyphomonas sediminis TaxID=2866160 RepID=UPI001C81C73B|nr:tol-pal system protein YbgF [Hyphomonas sediminis]MBY9066188.1 tol-pal system protein YbgF [Hyphomonas sediminis]
MLKASLTGLAILGLAATPAATAQTRGAPIVKGVTTGDLSVQVDQTRQQTADLMLEINRNGDRINQLNGRIETLEFELSRMREANKQQTLDNEALAAQNAELRQIAEGQARAIAAIQMTLGLDVGVPGLPGADGASLGSSLPMGPAPQDFASAGGVDPGVPAGAPGQTFGQAVTGGARSGAGPSVLTPAQPVQTTPAAAVAENLPEEAAPLFAVARQRLLALDYAGSQAAFQKFVDKYPSDGQAGEAYFWLGETLHQQNLYAESGQAYTTMIRSFPDDQRAPDALARLARAMRLIGEPAKACQALDTLPKRYPNASKVVRDLAAVERTRSGCKG